MKNQKSLLFLACVLAAATVAPAQQTTNRPAVPAIPIRPMRTAGTPAPSPAAEPLLKAGVVAPDFMAKDLAGKDVRLSDAKGKIVVLDFWATWCGPCMRSLPHTEEVAKRYKDEGVVVLANCTADTRANFEKWMKDNQQKYPDIAFSCDPNDRGSATYDERASKKLYHVAGSPTQFIMGRDGKIAAVVVGYSDGDARLEASLARVGVKVDPATVAKGEEQLKKGES